MSSRETQLQALQFELAEARQVLADIDGMTADLVRLADELGMQIEVEQERHHIRDANHFAYPTSAKAALMRRNNLLSSIADLKARREEAVARVTTLGAARGDAEQRLRRFAAAD